MRRLLGTPALLLALAAGSAGAQKKPAVMQAGAPKAAVTWKSLVGEWHGKSMKGTSDSVITTVTTSFKPDHKIWLKMKDRPAVAARLISMAGDSVVIESDKYESITRPGHKTSLRMTSHVNGSSMVGTFRATFDDGKTLEGHTTSTRAAQ